MLNIIPLPKRKVKTGPRGKAVISVGQTWVEVHSTLRYKIRNIYFERGTNRIVFSRKNEKKKHLFDLAERTFRYSFMIEPKFIEFENALRQKLQEEMDRLGLSEGMCDFFALKITPPSKRNKGLKIIK